MQYRMNRHGIYKDVVAYYNNSESAVSFDGKHTKSKAFTANIDFFPDHSRVCTDIGEFTDMIYCTDVDLEVRYTQAVVLRT